MGGWVGELQWVGLFAVQCCLLLQCLPVKALRRAWVVGGRAAASLYLWTAMCRGNALSNP